MSSTKVTTNGLSDKAVSVEKLADSTEGNYIRYGTDGEAESISEQSLRRITVSNRSLNYTAVLTDANNAILHPTSDTTARTFTIPANSSVAYPTGTTLTFVNQNSAGEITLTITDDTMRLATEGTTDNITISENGIATAFKITSTEWIVSGANIE